MNMENWECDWQMTLKFRLQPRRLLHIFLEGVLTTFTAAKVFV